MFNNYSAQRVTDNIQAQDQAWVFARSVLPLSSLVGVLRHLRKQGNRPLGAFLFSQPKLIRSPIALSLINRHHNYVPAVFMGNAPVWGRRSIFYVANKPLLVSEVFLPSFPAALNAGLSDAGLSDAGLSNVGSINLDAQ